MKRSYIYLIVVLLTVSLVSADYIIGKDLKKIIPLDETYRTVADDDLVKEAKVTGSLTIKNEQNTDENITYKYSIKVKDLAGACRFTYNNKDSYMIFTANGEATFELKSNESIVIHELPVDSEYTVIQLTTNQKYTIKVNQVEQSSYSGVITEGDSITFNNASIHEEPKKPTKEDKPKEEKPKEEKKEDKKPDKKDIPNTGTFEIGMGIILVMSLLLIYLIKKIRVKRFE
ncbi:MAG: hypothetical protein II625_06960 [Bacilli bacterium]|nr:hypothetical protein [Bacilli bacterium]